MNRAKLAANWKFSSIVNVACTACFASVNSSNEETSLEYQRMYNFRGTQEVGENDRIVIYRENARYKMQTRRGDIVE